MKLINLGNEGLKVSQQGFGCMGFTAFYSSSIHYKEEDAIKVIRKAYELGVTHFDTAQFYSPKFDGANEELVGKALSVVPRDTIQIATKGGLTRGGVTPDGSPQSIREMLCDSLKRLNTDYVDLFYLARIDTKTPLEETIQELKKLVNEGKIRYIGLSEASEASIRLAHSVHPITAVQCEWSLMWRDYEPVIKVCRDLGIGIVPYCPIARGFLSGQLDVSSLPPSDFRTHLPTFAAENLDRNYHVRDRLKEMSEKLRCTMAQLALAWVQHQGSDVSPIPGTTNIDHLVDNVKALEVKLSDEDVEQLNNLFPPYAFSGDRLPEGFPTFKSN